MPLGIYGVFRIYWAVFALILPMGDVRRTFIVSWICRMTSGHRSSEWTLRPLPSAWWHQLGRTAIPPLDGRACAGGLRFADDDKRRQVEATRFLPALIGCLAQMAAQAMRELEKRNIEID